MSVSISMRRGTSVLLSLIILLTVIYSFGFRDSVSAASADFDGSVTAGQTWVRPIPIDNSFTSITPSPTPGIPVCSYAVTRIAVSTSGNYSVSTSSGFDAMIFIYSGEFDPASPYSNFIIGDDDSVEWAGDARVASVTLTAGQVYSVVTSLFGTVGNAAINVNINGAGDISTPVILFYGAGTGGSISGNTPQVLASGMTGTEVTVAADANYHFIDWSDGAAAAARTDSYATGDLDLTANFAIDSHNVSFDSKGGSMVADIPADYNTAILAPAVPTMTGYTFDYWYYVADGTEIQWNFDTDTVTDNVTLSAHWTINSYTVIFQDWNGTVISQVTVDYGSDAAAPAIPVRTGYTFTSWSLPFTAVTGDITTIAGYSLNPTPAPTSTPTLAPTSTPTLAPTSTPTLAPTPLTVVLGTNITATPTAAPTTGILGAAKTGETANHMTVLIGCVLLTSFGAVGSVFVIRRKRTQD